MPSELERLETELDEATAAYKAAEHAWRLARGNEKGGARLKFIAAGDRHILAADALLECREKMNREVEVRRRQEAVGKRYFEVFVLQGRLDV